MSIGERRSTFQRQQTTLNIPLLLLPRRPRIRRSHTGFFADDFVADAVRHRSLRVKEPIALAVLADLIHGLAGAFGHYADERFLGLEDFLGLNFDIRGLTVHAAERLMD